MTDSVNTVAGNRTLREVLQYRAAATPDKTFVVYDDLENHVTALTYAQFDAKVNQTANLLLSLGITLGDKINLHLPNCLEFLYLWFGAAKVGAVIMPTNTGSVSDELEYLVSHSESRLIFTKPEFIESTATVAARCDCVERIIVCGEAVSGYGNFDSLLREQSVPPHDAEPLAEVAILYTSGTTSRPKGVLITNANYIYAGETVAKAIRLSPEDRHLVMLPLFHGNAQYYSTMSTLMAGASMVLTSRFSASAYFDKAIEHGCTVGSLFAAPIRMILAQTQRAEQQENNMRVVIFAQSVTEGQLDQWQERFGAPLLQLYGMTETMGTPLMNPMDYRRDNMSIGLPSMGYEVKLVDDSGAEVEQGEIGQIIVRGLPGWSLMKGYFKNPQATSETLRDGWLWTGDNAVQGADGYFRFVDRAKDMIKRAGENVAATEVEAVIQQHPAVYDCAVIGVPDPMRDEAIKAFVVLRDEAQVTDDEIIAWCRERLAKFRVPELVEFRDELPRTSVGKIQKHILRRQEATKNN